MTGLVVPVDLQAFCVSSDDATNATSTFAGAGTDFSQQITTQRPGILGANVTRAYTGAPLWPLEAGVHLHWAMPDGLTRTKDIEGSFDFYPLPNRWLVSRLPSSGNTVQHWIIESDTLTTSAMAGYVPPSVPAGSPPGFRYLGVTIGFTTQWREPGPAATGQSLLDLTGSELTAVASGDIAFAAFYPDSRGVFGFHDSAGTVPAVLAYVVNGWYSDPDNDPLSGGLSLADLQAQLGWTLATTPAQAPTYSVYSGTVHGIQWDDTDFVTDGDPLTADVAVGNTPGEALAAYFCGQLPATSTGDEELLALYLSGLAPALDTPTPGQLGELDEALHELQFTGLSGGTIWTVSRGSDEVTALPLPLADALNLLNQLQQTADGLSAQLVDTRWRLFAAWCRLFEVAGADLSGASAAFAAQLARQSPTGSAQTQAAASAGAQQATVTAMLSGDLTLTAVPAARFYAPNEPVVLLAGDAAAPAVRYGGDGAYDADGYLVCRLDSDVNTQLMIGTSQIEADDWPALGPDQPNGLPYQVITDLVLECVLIDPAFAAIKTQADVASLATDLTLWLTGQPTTLYSGADGRPPSPVEVTLWTGNPWSSLLLLWELDFHPLLATPGATAYPANYVTDNVDLDPDQPRLLTYAPTAQGIRVDPSALSFDPAAPGSGTQRYQGTSVLSPTAANNLRARLADDLAGSHSNPGLAAIATELAGTDVQLQALTGFGDALLSRQQTLLLTPGAGSAAPAAVQAATTQLNQAITAISQLPALAPDFDGGYTGVRLGFWQLSLEVVNPFGQRRPVAIQNLYTADSLTAYARGSTTPLAGVGYAPPRLTQPSRLLFRWLAADSTGYDEMNAHPATTPVCGWLLPSHLQVGFFIYNAQGNPLGSLTRRDDGNGIDWQAAPGDPDTIDADLSSVLGHQNVQLQAAVSALATATPAWFAAVYTAADTAMTQIVPATSTSQASLASLVGRPLALVQAALRLERQGGAAFDQSLASEQNGGFPDTDHGTGGVQIPVLIGDLARLDDGLVGFWKQAADGSYATDTFYSEAALTGTDAVPGVVAPDLATLLLTPQALPEAPGPTPTETKLLMLVDPRAAVHATTGVLPTQQLVIPPDQYEDLLDGLELTVPAAPVLTSAGGLQVPLPNLAGFRWAWIEEQPGPQWRIDPDVTPTTAGAVWQYSPQAVTEGWLRLDPDLLTFSLAGPDGRPVVTAGATVDLTLRVTNSRRSALTFSALGMSRVGGPVAPPMSTLDLHFGSLVAANQIAAIQPLAEGWGFSPTTDPQYGTYLRAIPFDGSITLAPGDAFTISLGHVTVATGTRPQARVYADYRNVIGLDDGLQVILVAVQP